uniref:Wound-induced protein 1 n=1 Tax=Anthurium amnicola TaxID=1678845 RepID=A0A1D1XZG4_9ARAE
MMRLLTGASRDEPFLFDPISITPLGSSTVLVEGKGWGRTSDLPVPWIHAWTVTDGIITQVREYFHTSLTVTRLGTPQAPPSPTTSRSGIKPPASSSSSSAQFHCVPLWQSRLSGGAGQKSVPGLVLAI